MEVGFQLIAGGWYPRAFILNWGASVQAWPRTWPSSAESRSGADQWPGESHRARGSGK